MKAICPNSFKHDRFITTAHVVEEWVVDENGNWCETLNTLETVSDPNPGNLWTCAVCGAQAEVK